MADGLLQHFELFKTLDPVVLSNLIPCFQPLHVESGEIIYRRGDKSDDSIFLKTHIKNSIFCCERKSGLLFGIL